MRVRFVCSVVLLLCAPLVGLACSTSEGAVSSPDASPTGDSTTDASAAAPVIDGGAVVIPSDAQQLVFRRSINASVPDGSTSCGPAYPAGISFDDETYTLTMATHDLAWSVCESKGDAGDSNPTGPWALRANHRILTSSEFADLSSTLANVHVASASEVRCLADLPTLTLKVTMPADVSTYVDADDGCDASIPKADFVDGLDAAMKALATLAH